MARKWTNDQINAMNAKGSVIVTASAGSGKTSVLTERVINILTDLENPVPADKLLIVTFTNAAAAEMRQRIEKSFAEVVAGQMANSDPKKYMYLKKQQLLIASADICTIDSFCIKLVRNHFSELSISPDFKIADKSTEIRIKNEALKEILDAAIEAENSNFMEFLKVIDSVYGDGNASEMILKLYEYTVTMANPKGWMDNAVESYNIKELNGSVWSEYVFNKAEEKISFLRKNVSDDYKEILDDSQLNEKCGDQVSKILIALTDIQKIATDDKREWDKLFEAVNKPLEKFPTIKSNQVENPDLLIKTRNHIKSANSALDALRELIPDTEEKLLKVLTSTGKHINQLVALCKSFYEAYHKKLIENSTLTFSLVEQKALSLLADVKADDSFTPTLLAKELSDAYYEVMVDEFQDVNGLQDTLFTILSNNGKKLFTVGDAKQSIYSFRRANPEFFVNKSNTAEFYSPQLAKETLKRVVLSKNFRSREGVCKFVNGFFRLNMIEKFGKIKYDKNEELYFGASFPEHNEPAAEIHLIEGVNNLPPVEAEGLHLAGFIKEQVKKSRPLLQKDESIKDVQYTYGDITVLTRSKKSIEYLAKALKEQGIPVAVDGGSFFDSREIKTVISMLRTINNPCDDIAILGLMASPIFGFTEDELALFKMNYKNEKLYTAILKEKKIGNIKAEDFYSRLQSWRELKGAMSVGEFVTYIIADSGYSTVVSAYDSASRRRANLMRFESIASSYSADTAGDLSDFLRYLEYLIESDDIKSASPIAENAVRFMTMHGSKGLQFPICILADLSSKFNNEDEKKRYIFSDKMGIGLNVVDDDENAVKKIFAKEMIDDLVYRNQKEEELRLLYVAMTRAEEKLALFISKDNVAGYLADTADALKNYSLTDGGFEVARIEKANCYADWIKNYLLLLPSCKTICEELEIETITAPVEIAELGAEAACFLNKIDASEENTDTKVPKSPKVRATLKNKLRDVLDYKYPYEELRAIEIKTSVSALTKRSADREYCATSRPAFLSVGGLTPRERGTALHKFMEFADFKAAKDNPQAEIDRLFRDEYISLAEKNAIELQKLKKFFATDLFDRILNCDKLFREQRFLLETKAGDIYPNLSEFAKKQTVIIQGAVDCMFIEDDHIVIIDFKTDRTTDEKVLLKHYAEQLKTYSVAAEKMFGLKVLECYIYSLNMSKVIKV